MRKYTNYLIALAVTPVLALVGRAKDRLLGTSLRAELAGWRTFAGNLAEENDDLLDASEKRIRDFLALKNRFNTLVEERDHNAGLARSYRTIAYSLQEQRNAARDSASAHDRRCREALAKWRETQTLNVELQQQNTALRDRIQSALVQLDNPCTFEGSCSPIPNNYANQLPPAGGMPPRHQ